MKLTIPYARQYIDAEDKAAVQEVLGSEFVTQGPTVQAFENAVAKLCGARYAVAVSNATAGLHLACAALDLGSEDVLWTSPISFVASANCGRFLGAQVDFVDIDPATVCMSPKKLEEKLAKGGRKPKVVIPVHFAGQSCDMRAIHELKKKYGFYVIEDAAHAIGSRYYNEPIGSCKYSDFTVFSFHPAKTLTTGEGGMVLTNNEDFYNKLIMLRSHGITRNKAVLKNKNEGRWYYEQQYLGHNDRLTDIQAALGLSQLKKLPAFVQKRQDLVNRYRQELKSLPLGFIHEQDYPSAWHLFVIQLKTDKKTRAEVFEKLWDAGIQANVHYIPIHLQPYYEANFRRGDFPAAETYYDNAITLPLYYTLQPEEQDYVIQTLREALK